MFDFWLFSYGFVYLTTVLFSFGVCYCCFCCFFFACYFCHIPFHFHSNSFSAIFWHSAKYILLISFEENVSLMKTTVFSECDVIMNCFHENKRFSGSKCNFNKTNYSRYPIVILLAPLTIWLHLNWSVVLIGHWRIKLKYIFIVDQNWELIYRFFFRAEKNGWTALNNGPFSDDTQIFEQREK